MVGRDFFVILKLLKIRTNNIPFKEWNRYYDLYLR